MHVNLQSFVMKALHDVKLKKYPSEKEFCDTGFGKLLVCYMKTTFSLKLHKIAVMKITFTYIQNVIKSSIIFSNISYYDLKQETTIIMIFD